MWYEGEDANGKPRKRLLNVGRSADVAKVELQRRKAGLLTRIVEGKEAPEPEPDTLDTPDAPASTVQDAVKKYLEECEDRCGQDGYGFSTNSLKAYKNRLSFLIQFGGDTPLAAVDEQFFKNYRKFLRECKKKDGKPIGDRHAHNVMATASGLMLDNKNMSGKKVLSQMSYAEKECCPYTVEELRAFFTACSVQEALVYKFFLLSGGREGEIANMEVRDLLFADGVLWIRSKRDRSFRLKGKKGTVVSILPNPLQQSGLLGGGIELPCERQGVLTLGSNDGDGNAALNHVARHLAESQPHSFDLRNFYLRDFYKG
jgi:hypothetical protein